MAYTLPEHDRPVRYVHLPLQKLDQCDNCSKSGNGVKLSWCAGCGDVFYCSKKCQVSHWGTHKTVCKSIDRVNLESYYPYIATLHFYGRAQVARRHPALSYQISYTKLPPSTPLDLLGNSVKLLSPLPPGAVAGSKEWWPNAPSEEARNKLYRRISGEGFVLPITFAVGLAILAEVYTSSVFDLPLPDTAPSTSNTYRRVRLACNKSPIKDFGIVRGTINTKPGQCFSYIHRETGERIIVQDPEDHFWLYFTNVAGEDFYLDCNIYVFNYCTYLSGRKYSLLNNPDLHPNEILLPAWFHDRQMSKGHPLEVETLWKTRGRLSLLLDERMREVISNCFLPEHELCDANHWPALREVMQAAAGCMCTSEEEGIVKELVPQLCHFLGQNLAARVYLQYPPKPDVFLDTEPGQFPQENLPHSHHAALVEYLNKLSHKLRKGKITKEQYHKRMNEWREKNYD